MGSGAKTPHQNYVVAPAVDDVITPESLPVEMSEEAKLALVSSQSLLTELAQQHAQPTADDYEQFAQSVAQLKTELDKASELGGAQMTQEEWLKLKQLSINYVEGLSPEDLQQIAAENGFQHPGLVGLGADSGVGHPLAFWLNPYYDSEEAKQKIQAKANAQFETLEQSGSLMKPDGTLLTASEYASQAPPGAGPKKIVRSPEEIQALLDEGQKIAERLKELNDYKYSGDQEKQLEKSIAKLDYLENQLLLANTVCTDPEFNWESPNTYQYYYKVDEDDLKRAAEVIKERYGLDLAEAALLFGKNYYYYDSDNKFKAFIAEHQQGIENGPAHKALAEYKAKYDELKENIVPIQSLTVSSDYWSPHLELPSLGQPGGIAAAKEFFEKTGLAQKQLTALQANSTVIASLELNEPEGSKVKEKLLEAGYYYNKNFGKPLRAWAKDQKIGDLRILAGELHPEMTATEIKELKRAQLQNLIIGSINKSAKDKYENPKPVYKSYGGGYNSSSGSTSSLPGAAPANKGQVVAGIMMPSKPVNFSQKYTDNMQALLAIGAAHAPVQDRPSQVEVENLSFQPTHAVVSGGAHSKSFYKDDKGRTWMFKPDNTNSGARADAEAAASEIMHAIGLPSVPVRTAKLEGKKGAIQPIIPNTTNLSGHASQWTQADVDGLVRMHVGSWLVGDHDGNNTNILKTEGGGIVPIDQGQAFKFVGRDRLALDYHPNSSFGSIPAYHIAYQAAMSGSLGDKVRVRPSAAVPVIDKIESIKDEDFKDMLRTTAEEGAKHKVEWYGPMQKKAKKMFGTDAPSDNQVAEAFLDTVVERKKNIRKDFAEFFSNLGFAEAEQMAEVG